MKSSKILHLQEYELPLTVHEEPDGGFTATCSVWPDCYAQGEMIEEAINEAAYTAAALIELYQEEDMHVPLKLRKTTDKKAADIKLSFPLLVSAS
jgi:predicted RNase H-like HicB family nuclease